MEIGALELEHDVQHETSAISRTEDLMFIVYVYLTIRLDHNSGRDAPPFVGSLYFDLNFAWEFQAKTIQWI